MKKYPIFIVLLGIIAAVGCGKSGNYPSTPDLKYKSIYPHEFSTSDSVAITCNFKDAEGDIQDSVWFKVYNITTPEDSTPKFASYPMPQDFPAQKNMEGNIILILKPGQDFTIGQGHNDSVYFDIFIKDNAKHISDTVRSDTVLVHG